MAAKPPLSSQKFLWINLFPRKSETEHLVFNTLKECQLFNKLQKREIDYISKFVHVRQYTPGEAIFSQYEKGLGLYIIAKGSVEIKSRSSQASEAEALITTLSAGSFFGELALVDTESKRAASAYATGPTTLIGFFKPDLLEIMERKPQTGVKLLFSLAKVLGKRLTEATELIAEFKNVA